MSEPSFGMSPDDDLPRTFRRERDARAANAYPAATDPEQARSIHNDFGEELRPVAVRALKVPFFRLALFFIKAAFAAIPALIVLGCLLWGMGWLLQSYWPQLVKMQILITFPK